MLTALARSAGAYGSRLTGAGWGGCTVSLVAEDEVAGFIGRVSAEYALYKGLSAEELKEVIFATQPSNGAFGEYYFVCAFELLTFSDVRF